MGDKLTLANDHVALRHDARGRDFASTRTFVESFCIAVMVLYWPVCGIFFRTPWGVSVLIVALSGGLVSSFVLAFRTKGNRWRIGDAVVFGLFAAVAAFLLWHAAWSFVSVGEWRDCLRLVLHGKP